MSTARPTIALMPGELGHAVEKAWFAVSTINDPPFLFQQETYGVRLGWDTDGRAVPRRLTLPMLREVLTDRLAFTRVTEQNVAKVNPPKELAELMLAWFGTRMPLPPLEGVVECPQVLRSGEIIDTPGYCRAGRFFYVPSPELALPPAPASIGADEVVAAVAWIQELLVDFPWATPADLTHAVGLALALVGRDVFTGSMPFHLVDKPAPGTGAGLLLDALCWPAIGRQLHRMTQSRHEEEMRKRLTSALRLGRAAIFLDNLTGRIDGEALSALLTSGMWEDRLLGSTDMVRVPIRSAFIGTSNNATASEDMARRFVTIRLDAQTEAPHLRPATAFRHPALLQWAEAHRGALLRALLTLWQHWFNDGAPRFTSVRLGSFEDWGEVIGGVLGAAGFTDFLSGREQLALTLDPTVGAWRAFIQAWWERFGSKPVHVKDLWPLVMPDEGDGFDLGLGEAEEKALKKRLGKRLNGNRDKYFGPYCLKMSDETSMHGRTYFLMQRSI
jgi:putative DNA primase/helicase